MLDEWLQVDLSFARESRFRKGSERFKLLFGTPTTSYTPLRDVSEALRALDSTVAFLIREAVDLKGERLSRLVVDLPSLAAADSHG